MTYIRTGLSGAILKASPPGVSEKWSLRLMVMSSFFWLIIFCWWFFGEARMGSPYLYWPLTIALCLKLMRMVYEWYHYLDIGVPEMPALKKTYKVDMLTTACPGEPHSMIIRTLRKMVAVKYPHTTYLCDEGDDPLLKKACAELGVIHVTRTVKKDAKAGNINNALKQATGDLCVILDPDHEPVPDFLDRVLPYFEDPGVGYVQVVQGYYNQCESFVARAAAEQTYHFYGPMMMCMNTYGTTQAIGANCTFRRAALDSIGGHAAGLTEDMHTAMKLQAKGWKALYVPEMLSRGRVPSTVSAFYKQQLKWARGTFELFFEVLPGLFKNLTWRQRFHHLMAPLYYLSGVVNLINILIPVLALLLGEYPWKVDIQTFILFYSPLLLMNLLIRQYAQRWLMEESERGFHMRGGLLQLGTWWVYIVGFVYSIFRVKVPYIPTPKEGEPEDNWKLVLPNIIASFISLGAVGYGLYYDYNPYSIFMAVFAIINTLFLLYFSVRVQQKTLLRIRSTIYSYLGNTSYRFHKVLLWKVRHSLYFAVRKTAIALSVIMVWGFLSYTFKERSFFAPSMEVRIHKNTGGFYRGIYLPEKDESIAWEKIVDWERNAGFNARIVSLYQAWGPESITNFPSDVLNKAIREKGMVPMITWEPWSSTFPEFGQDFNLATDRKILSAIAEGRFDFYLEAYCEKIKALQGPVFLRFAHEPDNPQYPWSAAGMNTPESFIDAHRYIVNFFATHGVSNVAWVWNPWHHSNAEKYYPGNDFVDWIGITGLNYGLAAMDGKWKSFEQIYDPFRAMVLRYGKPVMISEFGSTSYGGNQDVWINNALQSIAQKYNEIRSITFFYSDRDKNWTTSWRPEGSNGFINWTFKNNKTFGLIRSVLAEAPYNEIPVSVPEIPSAALAASSENRFFIKDSAGFQFNTGNGPFYIKGVAYNTGGDWKDGNIPLTKNLLTEDFAAIREMGGNTIRRYGISIYDQNVLEAADETGLKVIYGFWLDPTVDYFSDTLRMRQYLEEIEERVIEYRRQPAVLAWCVGNETWGLLKHSYYQPYLCQVRSSYTRFVEKIARRIHALDSLHPVLTAMEHTKELPAELSAFRTYAPSVDFAGINSYYIENIRELDSTASQYYSGKPYLITEFGPKGYWNSYLSQMKNDSILEEESDKAKAAYYSNQWKNYIEANKGHNIGGIAYCWHDRMEGTATWFGITDYRGRKKAIYYKLKEAWTGKEPQTEIPDFDIEWESASLVPGLYHAFKVRMLQKAADNYRYEWFLRKENSMEEFPGYIREFVNGKRIFMKVPDSPGLYRLYLYVYDDSGNVATISHPITVTGKASPKNKI